jgi:hypothetical protein
MSLAFIDSDLLSRGALKDMFEVTFTYRSVISISWGHEYAQFCGNKHMTSTWQVKLPQICTYKKCILYLTIVCEDKMNCELMLTYDTYCFKLYLLYLIIIVLMATWKINLLLLTVLSFWNKVITYLLIYIEHICRGIISEH